MVSEGMPLAGVSFETKLNAKEEMHSVCFTTPRPRKSRPSMVPEEHPRS